MKPNSLTYDTYTHTSEMLLYIQQEMYSRTQMKCAYRNIWKALIHTCEILSYIQLEISVETEDGWLVKKCNFKKQVTVVNLLACNSDVMSAAKNKSNQSNGSI